MEFALSECSCLFLVFLLTYLLTYVQAELEEQLNLAKVAEDHAKKAAADASRLAEELRQEQDHSTQTEKARRIAETMAKDLQTRLDEAEAAAMQGGRKIVQKMEQVRPVPSTLT